MINEALTEIKEMCAIQGYDMVKDGHLPEPIEATPISTDISQEVQEELNYFHDE